MIDILNSAFSDLKIIDDNGEAKDFSDFSVKRIDSSYSFFAKCDSSAEVEQIMEQVMIRFNPTYYYKGVNFELNSISHISNKCMFIISQC